MSNMIKKDSEEFINKLNELDERFANGIKIIDTEMGKCKNDEITDCLIDCYNTCQIMRSELHKSSNGRDLNRFEHYLNMTACLLKSYMLKNE